MMGVRLHRFIITIEGPGWTELDEVELQGPPDEGDPIETKVGTCVVIEAELPPSAEHGKIICRLP
jgi:hypothetical protein